MDNTVQKQPLDSDEVILHRGLILNPKEEDHWEVGSGLATQRFGATASLNPNGDWTAYKAQDEHQSILGFDTMLCWVFSTLKPWIMLANFYGFNDFPKNIAERYVGVMADASPSGGDPHYAAEVVRTISGVIPQEVLPWTDDIDTWPEYYHPNPMDTSIISLGAQYLKDFTFGHEWIFAWGNTYTPEQKAQMIKDASKRGTVAYSVSGNYRVNNSGQLTKPVGEQDTHWVTHLRFDGDIATFHDQYDPFERQLEKNYDHNAAKLYFLSRNTNPVIPSFWQTVINYFTKSWAGLKH